MSWAMASDPDPVIIMMNNPMEIFRIILVIILPNLYLQGQVFNFFTLPHSSCQALFHLTEYKNQLHLVDTREQARSTYRNAIHAQKTHSPKGSRCFRLTIKRKTT
jgi:hypothetical protein